MRLLPPKIGSGNFYSAAHLIQTRTCALTDSVGKSLSPSHRQPPIWQFSFFFLRRVEIVASDDCAAGMTQIAGTLNVSSVQNISDGVANPVRRFDASEIVNHKDLYR